MLRTFAGAVVLSLAATACQSSLGAPEAASPSVTPSAQRTDAELVKAALEKTRAAGTATFVLDGTITVAEGSITTHTEGAYDLGEARARAVRTFEADPPDVLAALTGDAAARPADLETRLVTMEVAAYLQMPAWPRAAATHWLRFDERDLARARRGGTDVSLEVFPALLEMLAHAKVSPKDKSFRGRVPPLAEVLVPAPQAFAALPTSATRRIVAAGLDPAELVGDVEVTVEVDRGYVTTVSMDAYDLIHEAYGRIGLGGTAGATFTEFGVGLLVAGHGEPVRIAVPSGAQVMTPREFEGLARG